MELSPGLDFAFNAATLDREAVLQALMDNKEPWWPKDSADDNASGGEPQESSLTSCSTEPEEEDKVMDSHAGRYVMEAMDEDICRAQKMAADSTQAMEAETTQLPADGPVFLARAQDCGKLHRVVLPSCNLPEPPQQKPVPVAPPQPPHRQSQPYNKFSPVPGDWAGQKLRALKDKHNEKEVQRRQRKLKAKADKAQKDRALASSPAEEADRGATGLISRLLRGGL